jgi:hypothetical protein
MKSNTTLSLGLGVLFAACSSTPNNAAIPAIGNNAAVTAPVPADEAFNKEPANTVLHFLQWYRAHAAAIKQIPLASLSRHPDSTKYYVVDAKGTGQYLAALKQSGFVSEHYLSFLRSHFIKVNNELKANPQKELPVKGLDFDLVMMSNDFDEDLRKIERSTVASQKQFDNDRASVTLELPGSGRVLYWASRQSSRKWQIDNVKDLRSAFDQAQND